VASIAELRQGIATNLATISGLRVSEFIPDNPNPPIAIVQFDRAQYHLDMGNGMTEYSFVVQLIVGRVDERTAQRNLDAYCSSSGSSSVLLAVESNRTLSGKAFDCVVTEMSSYGPVLVNDTTYLGAEFQIRVLAS
jgi:hypothetical protein